MIAQAGLQLSDVRAELGGRTLGDVLLTPTRIYARDCLALIEAGGVRAFSHITGGGLAGNLARVLPASLDAEVQRNSWSPLPIFQLLASQGGISRNDAELAFNLGVGMVAIVAPDSVPSALSLLAARGVPSWVLGQLRPGRGQVRMTGDYVDCGF